MNQWRPGKGERKDYYISREACKYSKGNDQILLELVVGTQMFTSSLLVWDRLHLLKNDIRYTLFFLSWLQCEVDIFQLRAFMFLLFLIYMDVSVFLSSVQKGAQQMQQTSREQSWAQVIGSVISLSFHPLFSLKYLPLNLWVVIYGYTIPGRSWYKEEREREMGGSGEGGRREREV